MRQQKFICRQPGKKSVRIIERDRKVISPSLTREYSFVWERSKGCYVYDADGRKYLDFAAGVAVANVGHSNPDVVAAISGQARKALHCGFSDFYAELPVAFAELLTEFLPKHLNTVFFSNSGTESVEAAYKLARWHTKKKWAIAFRPSFHGRTMGSLSLTNSRPVQRERYGPFLPVKHVNYPYPYRASNPESCGAESLAALERNAKSARGNLAAIFLEPISGEGGYVVPPAGFIKGVREICDRYDALLVADEVQSGCYRTGKFLAIEHSHVKPDIVCLSKAIGGGLPFGVTIANSKTMDWVPGSHANTFGGNLAACAAGIAVLKYMRRHRLGENAASVGKELLQQISAIDSPHLGDVRGKGLMLGMEIVKSKKSKAYGIKERGKLLCSALSKGLLLLPAGISSVRLAPPLILSKKQASLGAEIINESFQEVSS